MDGRIILKWNSDKSRELNSEGKDAVQLLILYRASSTGGAILTGEKHVLAEVPVTMQIVHHGSHVVWSGIKA